MVNTAVLKDKLVRGVSTGVGVFASRYVGSFIDNQTGLGNLEVGAAQGLVGYGVAVATDIGPVAQTLGTGTMLDNAVEHVGYGIHAAGFAEALDELGVGTQTGARSQTGARVVRVDANSESQQTGQTTQRSRFEEFSLDTA